MFLNGSRRPKYKKKGKQPEYEIGMVDRSALLSSSLTINNKQPWPTKKTMRQRHAALDDTKATLFDIIKVTVYNKQRNENENNVKIDEHTKIRPPLCPLLLIVENAPSIESAFRRTFNIQR